MTIESSVRYIPQSKPTKEKDSKPSMIKNNSLPEKNFHKPIKKSIKT